MDVSRKKESKLKKFVLVLKTIFLDKEFIYMVGLVGFSLLGMYYEKAFFAANLTLFIKENSLLVYVIKSTFEHID